jgi:trehalose/maltose hydrolase-like predicted phosphorylase
LARAGQLSEALATLDVAARIDLDDLTGSTAGGVHLATMGGLWQSLVFGFAGIRPRDGALIVDPMLPERWDALELRLRFRGHPLALRIDHDEVSLSGAGLVIGERDGAWEVKLQ